MVNSVKLLNFNGCASCLEVSQFLYTTDCLDGQTWDTGMLGKMPDDFRQRILTVALETAIRL